MIQFVLRMNCDTNKTLCNLMSLFLCLLRTNSKSFLLGKHVFEAIKRETILIL